MIRPIILIIFITVIMTNSYAQSQDLLSITVENADQLEEWEVLKQSGRRTIDGLSWSADGSVLAAGIAQSIILYSVNDLDNPRSINLGSKPYDVEFSPITDQIAFVDANKVYLRDVKTDQEQSESHQGAIRVAFSPDGKLLASGSGDGSVYLWDTATLLPLGFVESQEDNAVVDLLFSPDGSSIVTRNQRDGLYIWSVAEILDSDVAVSYSQAENLDLQTVTSFIFSPNDSNVLISRVNQQREISTLQQQNVERSISGAITLESVNSLQLSGLVVTMAFNPQGDLLVTGSSTGEINLFDLQTGEILGTLPEQPEELDSLAFNPQGTILASADRAGNIRLWMVG